MKDALTAPVRVLIFSLTSLALVTPPVSAKDETGFSADIAMSVSHDSNIRRNTEDNEQSDETFLLNPDLNWKAKFGKHFVGFNYEGDYGRYQESNELDFNDHSATFTAELRHSLRFNTEFELKYIEDHDDPGSTNASSLNLDEFNKFELTQAQGKLTYGTPASNGQLSLRIRSNERRYTNNQQSFRDYDLNEITGNFFYRIAPKTRLLFETTFADYDYQPRSVNGTDQSNEEQRYLFGVEWESTAKTTGVFKAGTLEKDYAQTLFGDISGVTLSLDMIWKPNTFTEVKIGVSRDTNESAIINTGGFISEYVHVDLKHELTPLTRLVAGISIGDEEYFFDFDRSDSREASKIGIDYEIRRWATLSAKLVREKRDSNAEVNDFSANALLLTFRIVID